MKTKNFFTIFLVLGFVLGTHSMIIAQEANIKDCIECGKALVIKSNRQKYCGGCARKINSEKSRKRMEKFRHGKRESRRYDLEILST